MEFNEYGQEIKNFADYPTSLGPYYLILGAYKELGILSEKLMDSLKSQEAVLTDTDKAKIAISAGDVIYYISLISLSLGIPLEQVISMNLRKLSMQKEANIQEKQS